MAIIMVGYAPLLLIEAEPTAPESSSLTPIKALLETSYGAEAPPTVLLPELSFSWVSLPSPDVVPWRGAS